MMAHCWAIMYQTMASRSAGSVAGWSSVASFGRIPKPRDYRFKLNKKVKALARKSALTYKAQDNAIVVVEDFSFDAPKTKEFVNLLKNLQVADKKSLLVLSEQNKNVYLSSRNLTGANVITVSELNTYKVLDNKALVLTESTVAAINNF